ncbi:hypothetical protein MKW92_040507 [Papaver armeniacum]|nr:hypothetical protein MKW92_040507 [Papaver armeniacum]
MKIAGKQSASVLRAKLIEDEFSDWPNGLLAIGIFGYNSTDLTKLAKNHSRRLQKGMVVVTAKENQITEEQISPSLFTPKEVEILQEELKKLLSRKPKPALIEEEEQCRTLSEEEEDVKVNNDDDFPCQREHRRSLSVIPNMGKSSCPKRTKSQKKKSIYLILKKMFVSEVVSPALPSFRDSIPESQIEKNLYCPEISPTTQTAKKFLKNGNCYLDKEDDGKGDDDEQQQNINDGCKWDKTDDDYIVLEI